MAGLLEVECPTCRAKDGERCVTTSGKPRDPHMPRYDVARQSTITLWFCPSHGWTTATRFDPDHGDRLCNVADGWDGPCWQLISGPPISVANPEAPPALSPSQSQADKGVSVSSLDAGDGEAAALEEDPEWFSSPKDAVIGWAMGAPVTREGRWAEAFRRIASTGHCHVEEVSRVPAE